MRKVIDLGVSRARIQGRQACSSNTVVTSFVRRMLVKRVVRLDARTSTASHTTDLRSWTTKRRFGW